MWVELCLLIQRDRIRGVLGTEDVSTMAAVMFPYEQVERGAAPWGVARRGCFVRLQNVRQ